LKIWHNHLYTHYTSYIIFIFIRRERRYTQQHFLTIIGVERKYHGIMNQVEKKPSKAARSRPILGSSSLSRTAKLTITREAEVDSTHKLHTFSTAAKFLARLPSSSLLGGAPHFTIFSNPAPTSC
jgi:hypothetical protein